MLISCFIDPLIPGLVEPLIHSFTRYHSVSCAWILSFHRHLNNHLLIRCCTPQLQHFIASASQSLSYRPLISYSHFLFRNFRPGTCRALQYLVYACNCMHVYMYISYADIYIYIYLSLSLSQSIYLSICLSICLSIYLSICLSIYP